MPPRTPGVLSRSENITSRENRWLKQFRAALRGESRENDLVGVEGARLVEEALRSGLDVAALLVSTSGERHLTQVSRWLAPAQAILRTSDRLFAGVAGTETPQGIAALVRPRLHSFDDLVRGGVPLVVVLIGVQDPGNVGTILRSAEAFGATGAIAARGTASPLGPKALRASAGSALRLPVVAGIAAPVGMAQLRVAGLRLIAASLAGGNAALEPANTDFREPCAILIGNEGAGLPAEVERSADVRVRIPLAEPVDSLNAAVAAAVLLYEAARQRTAL